MSNGTIDLDGLPVVVPGTNDYLVGTQNGAGRKWRLPDVTNAAAAIHSALNQAVADAEADIAPVIAGLGYAPPVAYTAGILIDSTRETVEHNGDIYAPLASAIPFTTSGAFEAENFRVIQGVERSVLAEAVGASLVGFQQPGEGAVARTVQAKMQDAISVKDFGAVGDGVTDDTAALQTAISAADGRTLDFLDGTYRVTGQLSASYTNPTAWVNGRVVLDSATGLQYLLLVRTVSDFNVSGMRLDGSSSAAKLLLIHPNDAECNITVTDVHCKNALQTDVATSVAAGVQISAEDGLGTFATAVVTKSSFRDIDSTRTTTPVGRGLYIVGAISAEVDRCAFERIGPYQDGDGVFVSADESDAVTCSLSVSNCSFKDCHKRSIKTQVSRALVTGCRFSRTQAFTDAGTGQAEIGLQYGGAVDGALFNYADGAAPRCIVAISAFSGVGTAAVPGTVRNLTIKCDDSSDIITSLFEMSMNDAGSDLYSPAFESVICNTWVKNVLYCYNSESSLASRTIHGLILRNITFSGFSASGESAYVFMTRGSSSPFNVNVRMDNVQSIANAGAFAYLDPTPGSTSFLVPVLEEASHVRLTVGSSAAVQASPVRMYRYFIAENSTQTKTFTLADNAAAVQVYVSYTSNRDSATAKLFTSGIVQSAGSKTYYRELIAGNKTDPSSGGIEILSDASANSFSVRHTAGSLSATGTLLITVIDPGFVQSVG